MDSLLREKMTQLTSKCDVLQKNVNHFLLRANIPSASISWKKLSGSRKMCMALIISNLTKHQKNYVSI